MNPKSGSQIRRKKKKQARRKSKIEMQKGAGQEEVAKPVLTKGVGLVHPTRLKEGHPADAPISELRQRFKSKALPEDRRIIAEKTGHYPGKRNFLPKWQRRQLRKLAVKKPLPERPPAESKQPARNKTSDAQARRDPADESVSAADMDSEELSDLLATVDPDLVTSRGAGGAALDDNTTFASLRSLTQDR